MTSLCAGVGCQQRQQQQQTAQRLCCQAIQATAWRPPGAQQPKGACRAAAAAAAGIRGTRHRGRACTVGVSLAGAVPPAPLAVSARTALCCCSKPRQRGERRAVVSGETHLAGGVPKHLLQLALAQRVALQHLFCHNIQDLQQRCKGRRTRCASDEVAKLFRGRPSSASSAPAFSVCGGATSPCSDGYAHERAAEHAASKSASSWV